jgi:beta-lactamase regulating signal transducer with metallopeptidase domain
MHRVDSIDIAGTATSIGSAVVGTMIEIPPLQTVVWIVGIVVGTATFIKLFRDELRARRRERREVEKHDTEMKMWRAD